MLLVEEDADGDMQQDAHDNTHDESLEHLVGREEEHIAQRSEGRHHGKKGQQQERTPELVAVVHEQREQDERDGNVVEHNAVEKTLVDVAVGSHQGHTLEEGVDAETDEKCGDV